MIITSLPRRRGRRFSILGFLRQLHLRSLQARDRRRLGDLDDHILDDIGLSRDEARREAGRKGWDAPDYWLR